MTKQFILYLFFLSSLFTLAQNKSEVIIEETTVDNNGKVISKRTSNDKEIILSPEEVLIKFYNNQDKIEELDKLNSFRFYQKTPFSKFKENMESKKKLYGKFISKKIITIDSTPDKKAVKYKVEVTYEKKNTTEQIIMIRETENSKYEIYDYVYESR
jgi:hypothetical protein